MKQLTKTKKSNWYLRNFWQLNPFKDKNILQCKRFFKRRRKNKVSSYFRISSLNFKQNFINITIKRGLKLKYANITSKAFQIFFFFFKRNDPLFHGFSHFFKWASFSTKYTYFFSINFLLKIISEFLAPRFTVQCEKLSKRLKKKTKLKYKFRLKYVQFHNDFKKALKWIYFYSKFFNKATLSGRLFYAILFTFFEEKKSFLYLKKIKIYKKMLKKSRARDNA